MPMVEIDEDSLDGLLVEHLKNSAYTHVRESKWQMHPEDREYNAKVFPALLAVIEYYSAPSAYKEFIKELFTKMDLEREDEELEQLQFDFDDEGDQ